MHDCFVKRGDPQTASLEGEAAALRWLAQAEGAGGMPVAEVVSVSPYELVERRVAHGSPNAQAAERVGRALAVTHAAGAAWWGTPPDGWHGSYLIAGSFTPTVAERDAAESWGVFFAEWRVLPYLRQARDAGAIDRDEATLVERVATRLAVGVYDAPQPGLLLRAETEERAELGRKDKARAQMQAQTQVQADISAQQKTSAQSQDLVQAQSQTRGQAKAAMPAQVQSQTQSEGQVQAEQPDPKQDQAQGRDRGRMPSRAQTVGPVARIHGDLWSGNLLWDADPDNPVGATLIDPMAHGGHAETDLAMLALFGCPFLNRIVSAYDEVSPLAAGWHERVRLHQLAPLLHHCALFGRSYTRSTLDIARAYA